MTSEMKQQFTARISQANKSGLVVILYEMTDCYLSEGICALEQGNGQDVETAFTKARGCINELLYSLHLEYEVAQNLRQLYMYCLRRMVYAARNMDAKVATEVQGIFARLGQAYKEATKNDDSPAQMQNTQAVYTGLTYGKRGVAETTCFFKESK